MGVCNVCGGAIFASNEVVGYGGSICAFNGNHADYITTPSNQPKQHTGDCTGACSHVMYVPTPSEEVREREAISRAISKSLTSFGFQHAIRHCRTPKYGDDAYVIETWGADTLANFIVDDLTSYIRQAQVAVLEQAKGKLAHYEGGAALGRNYRSGYAKGNNDALDQAHAVLDGMIEHKRNSGATEKSIERQRSANVKMLEDFIRTGETGVY